MYGSMSAMNYSQGYYGMGYDGYDQSMMGSMYAGSYAHSYVAPQTFAYTPAQPAMNPFLAKIISRKARVLGSPATKKPRLRRSFKELVRNVRCRHPGCDKVYASESSLLNHLRLKHNNIRPPESPKSSVSVADMGEFSSGDESDTTFSLNSPASSTCESQASLQTPAASIEQLLADVDLSALDLDTLLADECDDTPVALEPDVLDWLLTRLDDSE
eukprot:comp27228_c0_seq1/m.47143 comp27228_c0_seq1/g.47143  ORF comp27228_c0_seq1/g.47143 comp27228_c0_seq1/m.47143 type:complete len:215 (-) comp27228_c0_seq1:240-884(-)